MGTQFLPENSTKKRTMPSVFGIWCIAICRQFFFRRWYPKGLTSRSSRTDDGPTSCGPLSANRTFPHWWWVQRFGLWAWPDLHTRIWITQRHFICGLVLQLCRQRWKLLEVERHLWSTQNREGQVFGMAAFSLFPQTKSNERCSSGYCTVPKLTRNVS